MIKFRFLITVFLLSIAVVLLFIEKGKSELATAIIMSVCAKWLYKEKSDT